jgi:hypothetical protein
MRALCLMMTCCALAWAQASYTYDINGRPVEEPRAVAGKLDGGSYKLESARSINGRVTPLERVEERVIEQDGSRRVIERFIRRYDPNGNPGQTEKIRIEERKTPDGVTATETLTWRADVNGRLQLAERARGETRPAGDAVSSDLSIERPTLNGAFETVEKRSATERKTAQGVRQETVTWRRDAEGRFSEALRQVTERTGQDGRATENQAQYEAGPAGKLELTSQTVSRSVKNADGSERTELDVYRVWVPGRPTAESPRLIEQQLVERRPGADGTVVESVSVRRPAPDGSNPSGAYRKIGGRVCAGECK